MCEVDKNKIEIIVADYENLQNIDFDCGDDDLNEFLLENSFINLNNNLSVIYLCKYYDDIIGYIAISSDSISLEEKLEVRYPSYPAIKVGRLAIAKNYHRKGVGSYLLQWVDGLCLELQEQIGLRFVSVDAYNDGKVIKFYNKNSFRALLKDNEDKENIPMYKDLHIYNE
ncbi:GNAT family N-acetyltransferase [Methanobrevibacter sp.]|uniref:GNAT family N-acetyltransferase n=1 Tax=Methanobrevibacter sp. TaxID=66852 RepID=UPI00388F30C6